MKRDLRLYISDISNSIRLIKSYTKTSSLDSFRRNIKIQDAVVRRVEIIGEAVKQIPSPFRDDFPDMPWKELENVRNFLVHVYFGINVERVWKFIKKDLPLIEKEIKRMKTRLDND